MPPARGLELLFVRHGEGEHLLDQPRSMLSPNCTPPISVRT
jgi:hypothetical protein